jgi:hypothetical protein
MTPRVRGHRAKSAGRRAPCDRRRPHPLRSRAAKTSATSRRAERRPARRPRRDRDRLRATRRVRWRRGHMGQVRHRSSLDRGDTHVSTFIASSESGTVEVRATFSYEVRIERHSVSLLPAIAREVYRGRVERETGQPSHRSRATRSRRRFRIKRILASARYPRRALRRTTQSEVSSASTGVAGRARSTIVTPNLNRRPGLQHPRATAA